MSDVLSSGDIVHVVGRRRFTDDVRRHLVGEVLFVDGGVARIDAFVFAYDPYSATFIKRPRMDRLVSLIDDANVITVLPQRTDVETLHYREDDQTLVLTDGAEFEMDISEFSPQNR